MFALSNYPVWYEIVREVRGLDRFFDFRFMSCLTGLRKPDAAVYTHAYKSLQVAPLRCIFIDDREKNCEAARAVGMDAIVFRDASALEEQLTTRGILK